MKNHIIKNRIYDTIGKLENKVCEFIAQLNQDIVKTICTINY